MPHAFSHCSFFLQKLGHVHQYYLFRSLVPSELVMFPVSLSISVRIGKACASVMVPKVSSKNFLGFCVSVISFGFSQIDKT